MSSHPSLQERLDHRSCAKVSTDFPRELCTLMSLQVDVHQAPSTPLQQALVPMLSQCPNASLTVLFSSHALVPPTTTSLSPSPFPISFPQPISSYSQTRKPFYTSWWSWLPHGSSRCLRFGKSLQWGAWALASYPVDFVHMETVEPGSHPESSS